MALKGVEQKQIGKFGSLTSAAHAKQDKSIFGGSSYCTSVCSYTDSFSSLSVKDGGAFDIFSDKGRANVEREKEIIEGKSSNKPEPKNFEMSMKSFAMLQQELGEKRSRVTLSS